MAQFKVVKKGTSEEIVFGTKKEVIEFLAEQTSKKPNTISKKINKELNKGTVAEYEDFTIKILGGSQMTELNNAGNEIKNEEEVEMIENKNEEIVEETVEEVVQEVNEGEEIVMTEQEYLESDEAAKQVEEENKHFEETINGGKTEEKEEEKPNKRRNGKGIIGYKNGEEFERFPSIKACATYMKDLLNLPHMPFTPIMKSVRENIDWNEYSFKHENEEDLHIPDSLKAKLSKQEEAKQEPSKEEKEEMKDVAEETAQQDEIIEEIVEEELA